MIITGHDIVQFLIVAFGYGILVGFIVNLLFKSIK